jgi:hypothetical protein
LRGFLGVAGKLASKLVGRILDERDVGQSRAAESWPHLEPLLKRLLIIFVRCVFHDNSVVPFADFAVLLVLAFPLLWDFDKSRR